MTGRFGSPHMSSITRSTPTERAEIEQFFEDRIQYGAVRGRARGHFYQLTADLIMLEHRPDYAKRFYDGLRAFRNRLRDTGEETSDAVELIAESLQHLPMYVLYGWETGIYNEFRHLRHQSQTLGRSVLHRHLGADFTRVVSRHADVRPGARELLRVRPGQGEGAAQASQRRQLRDGHGAHSVTRKHPAGPDLSGRPGVDRRDHEHRQYGSSAVAEQRQ
jgi:hypothetical protein